MIGRLIDALDQSAYRDNTIVVLWGDHGWHLGDHGMWSKHSNYEQAAHIPLVVAAPGMKAGTRSAALVENVDIYPTLCELAGLPKPSGLDGASFAAVLRNPAASTKESIIHVFPRGERLGRAIRTARHRLVEWKKPGAPADTAELELYDYEADPGETKNLAAEQPEVVAKLRALLAKHSEAQPPFRANNAAAKPPVDRAALFATKDKDADGKLTRAEFLSNQPDPLEAPKRFERFDTDTDGALTREEFIAAGAKR